MHPPDSTAEFHPTHPVLRTAALWHPDPAVPRLGYAVVLFRRRFTLKTPARQVRLWVSASQRYILRLDGKLLSRGPSRSDPTRWGAVCVPVGTLAAGPHVLTATVVHFGDHAGKGQMGPKGFFLLHAQGAGGDLASIIDTGPGWRCWHDTSRTPIRKHEWAGLRIHDAIGSGEHVDGSLAPWGWETARFNDRAWPEAKVVCPGARDDWGNRPLNLVLRPDPLPPMEETPERFARVADAPDAWRAKAQAWITRDRALTIPANTELRLVLDRGELTNAYPQLTVTGGKGAAIRLVTCEAPRDPATGNKGNRDDLAGKAIVGHVDEFLPDGGKLRAFETLWFRAYRYIELRVRTARQPLTIHRLHTAFTGFPLRRAGGFDATGERSENLRRMDDITWRTARLCAHETFFDCPHYEQGQFEGDTRVQAVMHYLMADDDRLARKAIDDFHASRTEDGMLLSHYPVRTEQVLPTFSLFWIGMLHDFRIYRGDAAFMRPYLPVARGILAWYERRVRKDGMLGLVEHAPFFDWVKTWKCGNAPQEADGGSSLLTLLFAAACGWMAQLETWCGYPELEPRWRAMRTSLIRATLRSCWDAKRGLLADTSAKRGFSVHAQAQGVLVDAWPAARGRAVLMRALDDAETTQPGTLYYRYYVAQALRRAGLGQRYFTLLSSWERLLAGTGLSTWPESDGNPRSDCHAWSVTPGIEAVQTILGVTPCESGAGFERLRFAPTLGPLESASGEVVTPRGVVKVALRREGKGMVRAELVTPAPAWVPGRKTPLRAGRHVMRLR